MIDDEVRRRLVAVVDALRLPIDARCRALVDALIELGVARLQAEGSDDAAEVDAAVDHLRLLLDDMTQQARILRFDALHEPTLASALERHGAPWPFG